MTKSLYSVSFAVNASVTKPSVSTLAAALEAALTLSRNDVTCESIADPVAFGSATPQRYICTFSFVTSLRSAALTAAQIMPVITSCYTAATAVTFQAPLLAGPQSVDDGAAPPPTAP